MATKAINFEIGKTYSFDTLAPSVLSLRIINAKVVSVMDADTAARSGHDIMSWHERVRSHLPAGYNKDPNTHVYVKFRTYSGEETIFSTSWINMSTLMLTEAKRIIATVDDVSLTDMEVIRKLLIANGYTNINVTLVE